MVDWIRDKTHPVPGLEWRTRMPNIKLSICRGLDKYYHHLSPHSNIQAHLASRHVRRITAAFRESSLFLPAGLDILVNISERSKKKQHIE
jgi:hypothetical protein